MLETWVLTVVSLEEQPVGDLGVREAAREQPQDLALALGQRRRRFGIGSALRAGVGEAVEQPAGHGRPEQRVAVGDEPDRVDQVARPDVLEQEAARAGADRRVDVLVEVEGGEDEDAAALPAATIWRVASMPSIVGIRMSIRITSGVELAGRARPPRRRPRPRRRRRCRRASRGSGGSRSARAPGRRRSGRGCSPAASPSGISRRHEIAAGGGRFRLRRAAEHRDALAHSGQAVARRSCRRLPPRPSSRICESKVVAVANAAPARARRVGCLSVFVSASWMIRYAERSTAAGSGLRRAFDLERDVEPGRAHLVDQPVEPSRGPAAARSPRRRGGSPSTRRRSVSAAAGRRVDRPDRWPGARSDRARRPPRPRLPARR